MKQKSIFSAVAKSVGYILLFIGCQMLASLICEGFFTFLLLNQSLSGSEFVNSLYTLLNKNLYETMLLSYLLFLGIIALILKKKLPSALKFKKISPLETATSLLIGFGSFPIVISIYQIISKIPAVMESQNAYNEDLELIASAGPNLFVELFAICIAGPILEEILFRGLVQNTLKKVVPPALAIFLAGLAFGLVHGNLYQMTYTLPLGVFMGYMAHRFSSLWPAALMHIAFNTSNYLPRIGLYLGYGEKDPENLFLYSAVMLFYGLSLLCGIILYQNYFGKTKEEFQEMVQEKIKKMQEKKLRKNQGEPFMAAPDFLVVGLGNPGAKYEKNRHNVGFMALDYVCEKENISLKNLRFRSLCGEGVLGGKKILFLKPQTFMNLSGEAVREAAAFYKIPPEKILVLFDDINFAPGIFRIREKGSAGGHNGIKSIISCLGSDAFPRVKMGVGAPPEGWDLMHHVLGNLQGEDLKKLQNTFEDIHTTVTLFAKGEIGRAGALFNGKEH